MALLLCQRSNPSNICKVCSSCECGARNYAQIHSGNQIACNEDAIAQLQTCNHCLIKSCLSFGIAKICIVPVCSHVSSGTIRLIQAISEESSPLKPEKLRQVSNAKTERSAKAKIHKTLACVRQHENAGRQGR